MEDLKSIILQDGKVPCMMHTRWEAYFFVKIYWSGLGMDADLCQDDNKPEARLSEKQEDIDEPYKF